MRATTGLLILTTIGVGAPARAQKLSDDDARIAGYTLTLDNVHKAVAASKQIHKLRLADPALNQALLATTEGNLDAQMKALDRVAPVAKAIAGAGLSTRDYSLTMVALSRAWLAAQAAEGPAGAGERAGVSNGQLAFIKQHRAELHKAIDELSALGREDPPS